MITLIIADDEYNTREGLRLLDWSAADIELKAVVEDGDEALSAIQNIHPDLLLTDIRMPCVDGLELTQWVCANMPLTKVILMTAYHDYEYALKAIDLGVTAFILKPSDPDEIIQACQKASTQIQERNKINQIEISLRRQLEEYQFAIEEKITEETEHVSNIAVASVIEFLYENYSENVTIVQAAAKVYLNPVYLSRLIKQETGQNFSDILTRIRLQNAMKMLADTKKKIYEISGEVGIDDSRYFSQLFKKHYGITPREFRERIMLKLRKDCEF